MIYKQCIDASFDTVKACERCSVEGCKELEECMKVQAVTSLCSEVCSAVGRLTARGLCTTELYDLCARVCDDCAEQCSEINNEYTNAVAKAARECAEACRGCKDVCDIRAGYCPA